MILAAGYYNLYLLSELLYYKTRTKKKKSIFWSLIFLTDLVIMTCDRLGYLPTLLGVVWLLLIVFLSSLHDLISAELEIVQTRNLCLLPHVTLQAPIQCKGVVSDIVHVTIIIIVIISMITQQIHTRSLNTTTSPGRGTSHVKSVCHCDPIFSELIHTLLHTDVMNHSQIVSDYFLS